MSKSKSTAKAAFLRTIKFVSLKAQFFKKMEIRKFRSKDRRLWTKGIGEGDGKEEMSRSMTREKLRSGRSGVGGRSITSCGHRKGTEVRGGKRGSTGK